MTEGISGRRLSPNSLMFRMIGAFVILIVMIFLVGTVSYSVAKNVVSEEVKASMAETVSAKGSYLELGLQQVDNQMMEIISMDGCAAYYLNPKLDVSSLTKEQTSAKDEVGSKIRSMQSISDFVYHIYLISDIATGLTTTPATMNMGLYGEFLASEEGQQIDASEQKWGYLGSHPFLEQVVYDKDDRFNSSDYAVSLWRKVNMKTNMILIVDIDKNTIYEALAELNNGAGSYAAFVAPGEERPCLREVTRIRPRRRRRLRYSVRWRPIRKRSRRRRRMDIWMFVFRGVPMCLPIPE